MKQRTGAGLVSNEDQMIFQKPRFGPFEINLNTIVVLVGFAGGLVAWGGTQATIQKTQSINETGIAQLTTRVAANEVQIRRIDTLEIRTATVEKELVNTASTMRDVQATLNKLAADMQTANAILARIEASQKVKYSP